MANQVTVGKKRNVTFICLDQDGNPNPVGSDGTPLDVIGIPTWSLSTLTKSAVPAIADGDTSGFSLVVAEDGRSADIVSVTAGARLALITDADRGDGVIVHAGSIIEAVGEAGPVPVIARLQHVFGEESAV